MGARAMIASTLVAGAIGAACQSVDSLKEPAVRKHNVCAPTPEQADHVLGVFGLINPAVLTLLPEGKMHTPPLIWVVPEDTVFTYSNAATFSSTVCSEVVTGVEPPNIVLTQTAFADTGYVLAHELVHFYLRRPPYLPELVEEGLACVLAWTIQPSSRWQEALLATNYGHEGAGMDWHLERARISSLKSSMSKLSYDEFQRARYLGVQFVRAVGWRRILDYRMRAEVTGKYVDVRPLLAEAEAGGGGS